MNTKTYVSLIIIVLAGIALYFMVRPSPVTTPASTAPINSMTYVCNLDKKINAEFYAGTPVAQTEGQPPVPTGSVKLTFENGNTMTLNQTISADGGRYANSDESFIFWSKGNGAMVLQNNEEKDYSGCIMVAPDNTAQNLSQVYASAQNGFSIRLGEGYKVDESYAYDYSPTKKISGVKFTVPADTATGTNLGSDSYVSVERIPNVDSCTADMFMSDPAAAKPTTVTDNGTDYSVSTMSDAGAGNRYEESVYAISGSTPCTAVRYFVHYAAIENFPAGAVKEFDKTALLAQFDAIRKTLVLNN